MNIHRIIAFAASALGVGAAILFFNRNTGEGEPAEPIPMPDLPDVPESISVDAPTGTIQPGGGSGISPNENEIEALARVIASEASSATPTEQECVAWTVRNRFRGKSIYAVQYPWRSQSGANPPFSSARDAKDSNRALAKKVLAADQSQDPTGGATSFFEPRMQDAFAAAGALARAGETGARTINGVRMGDITRFKNYKKTADEIRKSWAPGSACYAKAGRFEFWGSARTLAKRGNPAPREVAVGDGLALLGASEPTGA